MLERIVGVRKLIVSILIFGVAVGIAIWRGDIPPGLVNVLSFIFAGFVVGNAVEHITDGSLEKAQMTAPPVDLDKKIENVNISLDTIQKALTLIIQKAGMDKPNE